MVEIRVICPGCRAEYRLPDDAIPSHGREVECAACGRVWRARTPASLSAAKAARSSPTAVGAPSQSPDHLSYTLAFGPASNVRRESEPDAEKLPEISGPVPLSRRVPERVLNILRQEVAHEQRARSADRANAGVAETGTKKQSPSSDDAEGDWPATTVTGPAASQEGGDRADRIIAAPKDGDAAEPVPAMLPVKSPASEQVATAQPAERPSNSGHAAQPTTQATPDAIGTDADNVIVADSRSEPSDHEAKQSQPAETTTATPHKDHQAGYRTGLGVAAMAAAACLALYLLAPGMSDAGPLGDALGDFRVMVDQGRMWLQDSVQGLFS